MITLTEKGLLEVKQFVDNYARMPQRENMANYVSQLEMQHNLASEEWKSCARFKICIKMEAFKARGQVPVYCFLRPEIDFIEVKDETV